MIDVAIVTLGISIMSTWGLLRRDRDLALVSALVTVGLVIIVIGSWQ